MPCNAMKCGFSPAELLISRKLKTNHVYQQPTVPALSLARNDHRKEKRQTGERTILTKFSWSERPETFWMPDGKEEAQVLPEAGTRS